VLCSAYLNFEFFNFDVTDCLISLVMPTYSGLQ